MTKDDYKKIAPNFPTQPGVYRFIDKDDVILYIGKAKHLKKRVSSYFGNRKDMRNKTRIMVRKSVRIEYTIVDTEQDALLLEATLIQKHQPRFNVMLKSGKPYPYICIKKERFPRVFITRQVYKDGSKYFGPYVSKRRMYAILELIKNLFQLRTCSLNLSEKNILEGKFKPCLEYHIKNCLAPCVGFETEEEYNEKVDQVANILKGHFASVKRYLKDEMQKHAEKLQFERAQEIKVQYDALENYQGKSTVVNPSIRDVDVFSLEQDDEIAYFNYLKVVDGAIINTFTMELDKNLDDDQEDLLVFAIQTLREKYQSIAPEVIVPIDIPSVWEGTTITIPKIGDKKKLLELSEKNLAYYVLQKRKQAASRANKQSTAEKVMEIMKKDLQMSVLPLHIECFDNSNLQGTNPVAAMVCFRHGKPSKRDYRHYHIKTVEGPDDFASMEEIVYRRYKRLLESNKTLPQLIIIDGGKGQLSAAVKSLKALSIYKRVTIIGIAKRLEEIYFPEDSVPLLLSKKSPTLKVIQQARNEAHRFAIEFHRLIRSKKYVSTQLTEIPGIGKKTAEKLLQEFASVEKIKTAEQEALEASVGKAATKKIFAHYGLTYKETEKKKDKQEKKKNK
ncbi:excinuclease ABC subunit UvrC [Aureispira sp. CCB-E]|uniref:excinuclease ABC subunit UvrC n=1 Tax=Aureispira sp. CCB-E TaxID=3051121 RepID=UPI00286860E0|nr:excinuclease ABC subunit UvrC [Aureispira sp. CCB-E]WMX16492.1 excinuclease ABC subunit UvrC [Aureispira sp. CCB-E]